MAEPWRAIIVAAWPFVVVAFVVAVLIGAVHGQIRQARRFDAEWRAWVRRERGLK